MVGDLARRGRRGAGVWLGCEREISLERLRRRRIRTAGMGFLSDVAGSLTGGLIGTDAASDAAKTSAKGAEAGIAEQRRQFDTTLQLQAPMINTGNAARSLLASIMGLSVPGSEFTVGGTTTTTPGARLAPSMAGGVVGRRPAYGPPVTTTTGGTTITNPAASPMGAEEITRR